MDQFVERTPLNNKELQYFFLLNQLKTTSAGAWETDILPKFKEPLMLIKLFREILARHGGVIEKLQASGGGTVEQAGGAGESSSEGDSGSESPPASSQSPG